MEKVIWIINNNRNEMIEAQRRINQPGSMRAVCLLSIAAVQRVSTEAMEDNITGIRKPSLIVIDYQMSVEEEFATLNYIKAQHHLAAVPFFFMAADRTRELDEKCYAKGAIVVVSKPFTESGILRIERMAWQHEVSRNFEKTLQKQVAELQTAKEISELNQQLSARNELLRRIFGRYFSEQVLETILEEAGGNSLGGQKRLVTVMMSDLRGFTSLSESLEPESVTELLNYHFGKMSEVIEQYQGTIIEFLGDSILAVFGAPIADENQAEKAIACAIAMQNAMGKVNEFCKAHTYPLMEMGIGIHQGESFIGNIGSENMMRYNVVGSVVNECSRIESYSVGGQILASEVTLENVTAQLEVQNRMEINTKGVQKPMPVVEVVGIGAPYNCQRENVEFDAMVKVAEEIIFNLYLVEGKHVHEIAIVAKLKEFSKKRAVIKLLDDINELDVYSNVEIFAARPDGRAAFMGVYAKVTEKEKRRMVLHFTHVNRSFELFADDLIFGNI